MSGEHPSLDFVVCQAKTKSGKPCTLPGEPDSGVCRHQHDPRWAEERSVRNSRANQGLAKRPTKTPEELVDKWRNHLDWSTPEGMVQSLQEAAGFVVARALSYNQGLAFAKLAERASLVRGWQDTHGRTHTEIKKAFTILDGTRLSASADRGPAA